MDIYHSLNNNQTTPAGRRSFAQVLKSPAPKTAPRRQTIHHSAIPSGPSQMNFLARPVYNVYVRPWPNRLEQDQIRAHLPPQQSERLFYGEWGQPLLSACPHCQKLIWVFSPPSHGRDGNTTRFHPAERPPPVAGIRNVPNAAAGPQSEGKGSSSHTSFLSPADQREYRLF